MTKFDHPDLEDTWFTVKEEPTMRDVLQYDSEITGRMSSTLYPRLWAGVKWFVDEWHCDFVEPNAEAEELLGRSFDSRIVEVIKWAGLVCFSYRQNLEPEKN